MRTSSWIALAWPQSTAASNRRIVRDLALLAIMRASYWVMESARVSCIRWSGRSILVEDLLSWIDLALVYWATSRSCRCTTPTGSSR